MKTFSTKIKKRIFSLVMALVTVLSISYMPTSVQAATNHDGLGSTPRNLTVYHDSSLNSPTGTVFANETFTVLDWYYDNDWNKVGHIEYSTAGGMKSGYVVGIHEDTTYTCVATANSYAVVYYGNNTSTYKTAGSISANEKVVVLGESGGWSYIEYNTTSGRKRGYVYTSCLYSHRTPSYGWQGFYLNSNGSTKYISGSYTIYSGPKTTYTTVGSVSNENVQVYYTLQPGSQGVCALFVSYNVTGTSQRKTGWIVYKNV